MYEYRHCLRKDAEVACTQTKLDARGTEPYYEILLVHANGTYRFKNGILGYRYTELYAGLASAINGVVLAAQSNASTWA
jgi:hypothetical protein